jgi:hypothetical protein
MTHSLDNYYQLQRNQDPSQDENLSSHIFATQSNILSQNKAEMTTFPPIPEPQDLNLRTRPYSILVNFILLISFLIILYFFLR